MILYVGRYSELVCSLLDMVISMDNGFVGWCPELFFTLASINEFNGGLIVCGLWSFVFPLLASIVNLESWFTGWPLGDTEYSFIVGYVNTEIGYTIG
jgi:hypothetical protein